MVHRVLPVLYDIRFKQLVFLRCDAILEISRITHRDLFIPPFLSHRILTLEREYTAQRNSQVRQCHGDHGVFGRLVHVHGCRKRQRIVRKTLRDIDTGTFCIVCRIRVINTHRTVTVETGSRKIDTGRKSPVRIRFRVLAVRPVQPEVFRQTIVVKPLIAIPAHLVSRIEVTRKKIPLFIRRLRLKPPGTFRIDLTRHRQIDIIAQCKVISSVAQTKSPLRVIGIGRHNHTGRISTGKREEAERQTDRI